MVPYNLSQLSGYLAHDAELYYTAKGVPVLDFFIAVNRYRKDRDADSWVSEADFFDCSFYGQRAKRLAPSLVKGVPVMVIGKLRQNHWERNGQMHSKVSLVADNVLLLQNGQSHEAS